MGEDIAAKIEILKSNAATEAELLPQGDKVPADAQPFKDELARITKLSPTSRPTPRLSATNTPTMSNTGLSTELVSRNSLPGWLLPRRLLLRVFPSHQILVKSRL